MSIHGNYQDILLTDGKTFVTNYGEVMID